MINLYDPDLDFENHRANWIAEDDNGLLIGRMNCARGEAGMTDLVRENDNNDVYYDFYVEYSQLDNSVVLMGCCNHGELDDWKHYEIPLTTEERANLLKLASNLYEEELRYEQEQQAEENNNN